jgi:hypothetical protein
MDQPRVPLEIKDADGRQFVIAPAALGAEGRFEDWLYLDLIQREWFRPATPDSSGMLKATPVSERAGVVVLFWSYFEGRVERLVRIGLRGTIDALTKDILGRYAFVGARMDRLYRLLYSTTYLDELRAVGAPDIAKLIEDVQRARNDLAHGQPAAITDELAERLVSGLRDEHFAWIKVFNRCIARIRRA